VEQDPTWCQEALRKVLKAMANNIRICKKSKRWWNLQIEEKRMIVGQEKRRERNSDEAARARAEFQKSIWKSKRQMWSNFLRNLRGVKVWRAAKYVNPPAGATVEALMDREDKNTNTATQKEGMLRREPVSQNDDNQNTCYPRHEIRIRE
jgi:hypothetical protein